MSNYIMQTRYSEDSPWADESYHDSAWEAVDAAIVHEEASDEDVRVLHVVMDIIGSRKTQTEEAFYGLTLGTDFPASLR